LHSKNNQQTAQDQEANLQAFGVGHNLFDMSSYGEVGFKHFSSNQKPTIQQESYDQSVSLVQMQDSMAFDDLKGMKKGHMAPMTKPIIEETGDSSMDDSKQQINLSGPHNVMEEALSASGRGLAGANHYTQQTEMQ